MKYLTNESETIKHLSDKSVAIYGMGEYGKRLFDLCENNNINVVMFIDNYSADNYKGLSAVKSDDFYAQSDDVSVVICNRLHYRHIYAECSANNVAKEKIFIFMPLDSLLQEINDVKSQVNVINNAFRKLNPLPIVKFETHLVNHCNLNCRGCDHYCPVADEWYADIESYKKDMQRMSEIFDGEAGHIRLIGGEPLLHPDVIEFMKVARANFKQAKIDVLTNGLLLPKMSDEFWLCCKGLNIGLNLTQYPVKFDYQAMEDKANSCGVHWKLKSEKDWIKTLFKIPLNLDGTCDPVDSYLRCFYPHNCHISSSTTLKQGGNLYTCIIAAHIGTFNKHFNQNIGESKRDYINIYSDDVSAEKILDFLAKPIPMCRFCDNGNAVYGNEWGISNKEISEWL